MFQLEKQVSAHEQENNNILDTADGLQAIAEQDSRHTEDDPEGTNGTANVELIDIPLKVVGNEEFQEWTMYQNEILDILDGSLKWFEMMICDLNTFCDTEWGW